MSRPLLIDAPSRAKDYAHKYYVANREKIAAYGRKWRAANTKRISDNGRRRYITNPEKAKAVSAKWYAANRERTAAISRRGRLRRKFGLTLEAYDLMLKAQGGSCAVCKAKPDGCRLAVDHDHATDVVRELLCSNCNLMVGLYFDSPERLRALLRYVEKHSQLKFNKENPI